MPYEELPHTADIRIKVYAETPEALFYEGVIALFSIIFGKTPSCNGPKKDSFNITSEDIDILFHDFLDEILYITLVLKRKICNFQVKLNENSVHFEYSYENLDFEKEVKKEIKAITYHNLHIDKKGSMYQTEVVMDV